MKDTGITFKHAGEVLRVFETRFNTNGALCLIVFDETGSPYAKLGVNVPHVSSDKLMVLSHDLSNELKQAFLMTGMAKIVGTVEYGFCQSEVVEMV